MLLTYVSFQPFAFLAFLVKILQKRVVRTTYIYVFITAAIGDVDGDGDLDLIIKNDKNGIKFHYDKIHTIQVAEVSVTIEKINLRSALKDNGIKVPVSVTSKLRKGITDKHLKDIDLLPLNQQKWTAYMGKWGNGHYTTN